MQTTRSSHAIFSLGYHIIWCPKYRHRVLSAVIADELKRVLNEACKERGWSLEQIEVMPDHVHLFVQADHCTAPIEIGRTLKSISATAIFKKFPTLKAKKFWGSGLWSRGTYYATVGHISEDVIRRYIETQKSRA